FQRALERLHAAAPLLPGAPGASFADAAEVETFLAANAGALGAGLAEFGALVQHQIVIDVSLELVLARVGARPEAAGAKALMAKGDRAGAGKVLQALGEAEKVRLGRDFAARLATAALDTARLPAGTPETVLNLAALSAADGADGLETALEEIDAAFDGALKIKLIGPTPAISFAAVAVETVDPARARAAADRLGVAPGADEDTVRRAYRAAMKRAHPDLAAAGDAAAAGEEARALSEAHQLLRRVAQAQAEAGRAGRADMPPRLATLAREGDAASAAARA
ncbi:MAG: GvpL/GvpF family gas vesicle protein, partial [Pseudomonadota bacterium]